ncbi:MAG: hypothetical protein KGH89_09010 [Thaumarchaeota archaeon]|nr:hypothetical protein [Nitrososphaerota archaeon]
MAKLYILRGLIVVSVGAILLVVGSNIFDGSYDTAESIMKTKHELIENKEILQGNLVNSTIAWADLSEHTILLVHTIPPSDFVKLQVTEPNGDTFEKESKNGFLYHIIEKRPQEQGNYNFSISNLGNEPVSVSVTLGEDPYLSGTCDLSNGMNCYAIPVAIGMVIVGIIALTVGSLITINDLNKKRRQSK